MQLPTRMVIVEGIPGSGKTTTAHFVRDWLAEKGYLTQIFLEGNLDHPADYESVACLSPEQYAALRASHPAQEALLETQAVVKRGEIFLGYRKLREQFPVEVPDALFHSLARHEVYELPLEQFTRVYRENWQDFCAAALDLQEIFIFECCYLQNLLTTLLARHNLDPQDAAGQAFEVADRVKALNPFLIYLEPPDVRRTLERAAQNRPAEWLEFVIGYVTGQAWGKANHQAGFDGLVHFYEMRRDVERTIFLHLSWRKLWITGAGLDWRDNLRQVGSFLENNLGGYPA